MKNTSIMSLRTTTEPSAWVLKQRWNGIWIDWITMKRKPRQSQAVLMVLSGLRVYLLLFNYCLSLPTKLMKES